LVIAYSK